ncbi:type II secretory pathway component PulF [Prosthecobacter fusiformis]|uniref:Type II secretory pathway component PulF n=1 Tax=Prosthecobacter fusiformis TaxID=48464 RepID=A0A4R7RN64_9BACT|nr:type II secretion system F family protein [Prosthecobacter fusiformis]TDU66026.1 type II secretory pathway component PulF [Prosthecobacter fusiformis]
MKPAEKTALYRELAKLTQADFHLDRSLTLLLSQKISPSRRSYLEGMQRGLSEGLSLAESVRMHNHKLVIGLELALIESGERSGHLSDAFNHLARYFASVDSAVRQMRGAMIYPLILLHLAILLPEIPSAIVATEGPGFLPRVLLAFGVLWVALAAVYFLWRWLAEKALTSPTVDLWLGRVPWIGPARRHWALARFCQVFHAGLLAALRISEVCRLAGDASQSGRLRAGALRAASLVEQGGKLSLSLAETGDFDRTFVNALATAEEVGKLDDEMARWMAAETVSASEAMEKASVWLPKMGYALVVVFVVYRIISMVQGYYSGILQHMDQL